tara:strand:- start:77 stop:478 length:402 start_codon:yes stop_codon:yes gene_type:complete
MSDRKLISFKNFKVPSLKEGIEDVRRANRAKEAALRKTNKDKEATVRRAEQEKEQAKRRAEREKNIEKQLAKNRKEESLVQKVTEYIKSDGARKKCAGGDGRRTENHDCDKVHSGMSHDEWEASQDTPKDEAK